MVRVRGPEPDSGPLPNCTRGQAEEGVGHKVEPATGVREAGSRLRASWGRSGRRLGQTRGGLVWDQTVWGGAFEASIRPACMLGPAPEVGGQPWST